MRKATLETLRKAIASVLAVSLVVTTAGPAAAQGGQVMRGKGGKAVTLGQMGLAGPGKAGAAGAASKAAVKGAKVGRTAAPKVNAARKARTGVDTAGAASESAAPVASDDSQQTSGGLVEAVKNAAQTGQTVESKIEKDVLVPTEEAGKSEAGSSEWAEKSFNKLTGRKVSRAPTPTSPDSTAPSGKAVRQRLAKAKAKAAPVQAPAVAAAPQAAPAQAAAPQAPAPAPAPGEAPASKGKIIAIGLGIAASAALAIKGLPLGAILLPIGLVMVGLRLYNGVKGKTAAAPSAAASASSQPSAPQAAAPKKSSKWKLGLGLAAATAATAAAAWFLFPGLVAAGMSSLAVTYAEHGLVVAMAKAAAFVGYYASNGIGFIFPLFQMADIYKDRKADVSSALLVTAMVSSFLLAFNWSYIGATFGAVQNLFGGLGFAAIMAQKWYYDRNPAKAGEPAPSKLKVWAKTLLTILPVGAATALLTGAMLAGLPLLPVAGLIVPFQIAASFGFAYFMLPGLMKIEREKSVGNASKGMAWAYLGATTGVALWAMYEVALLTTGGPAATLMGIYLMIALLSPIATIGLKKLSTSKWSFLPEKVELKLPFTSKKLTLTRETLATMIAFLPIAVSILASVGLAYLAFDGALDIFDQIKVDGEAQSGPRRFLTLMVYVIENILGFVATSLTIRAFSKYGNAAAPAAPSAPQAAQAPAAPVQAVEPAAPKARPWYKHPAMVTAMVTGLVLTAAYFVSPFTIPAHVVFFAAANAIAWAVRALSNRKKAAVEPQAPAAEPQAQPAATLKGDLLTLKTLTFEKVQAVAPDARLVAISADPGAEGQAAWSFRYHSPSLGRSFTVLEDLSVRAELASKRSQGSFLSDEDLKAMRDPAEAYDQVAADGFNILRLQIVATKKGPMFHFADHEGRTMVLPALGAAPEAAPAQESAPEDSAVLLMKKMAADLVEAKAQAQALASKKAKDARLVGLDLDRSGRPTIFIFHSRKTGKAYAVVAGEEVSTGKVPAATASAKAITDAEVLEAFKTRVQADQTDPGWTSITVRAQRGKGPLAKIFSGATESRMALLKVSDAWPVLPKPEAEIDLTAKIIEPAEPAKPSAAQAASKPLTWRRVAATAAIVAAVAGAAYLLTPISLAAAALAFAVASPAVIGVTAMVSKMKRAAPAADAAEPVKAAEPAKTAEPAKAEEPAKPEDPKVKHVQALAKLKDKMQARISKVVPDARLIGVDIAPAGKGHRLAFLFHSKAKGRAYAVSKGVKIVSVKLGGSASRAGTFSDEDLGLVVDAWLARPEAVKNGFEPVKAEVRARAGKATTARLIDKNGRTYDVSSGRVSSPKEGKAAEPPPAKAEKAEKKAEEKKPAPKPKPKTRPTDLELPPDARAMTSKTILKDKREADSRVKAMAKDARLVEVAINLDDDRAHWMFIYRSGSKKLVYRAWEKRVGVYKLPKGAPEAATVTEYQLERIAALRDVYAQLRAEKARFRPVRVELHSQGRPGAVYLFRDAADRTIEVPAKARDPESPPPETAQNEPSSPSSPPPSLPPPPSSKSQVEIREDFFGFRSVHGIRHDAQLGRLASDADAATIISHISRQFSYSRARVLGMAEAYGLREASPAHEWRWLYRRLQSPNQGSFEHHDHGKYKGFRALANRTYPPGWKGRLLRAAELHKHLVGFVVRLPYHLFDMFFFGYFRRAASFEFVHSTEDFLGADFEKHLKAALEDYRRTRPGLLSSWRFSRAGVLVETYLVTPLLRPLLQFLTRRLILAAAAALVMGVMGFLAPALPFLSFSLTSIPILGEFLVTVANGLPWLISYLPFVGEPLSNVAAAAIGALMHDLVLGVMLNTLLLSTLMTFPRAVKQAFHPARWANPSMPESYFSAAFAVLAVKFFFSWAFWRQNWKSFASMATVGAEIEGIMTYAGEVDSFFTPAAQAVLGRDFKVFHTVAAAVERDAGHSPIAFGGAITWGNLLLDKAQTALGFNLSNAVMHQLIAWRGGAAETEYDSGQGKVGAAEVFKAAVSREGQEHLFDPELHKKSPEAVAKRIGELRGKAGHIAKEIKAVNAHSRGLRDELAGIDRRIAELMAQRRPVTPEERERQAQLERDLEAKRAEEYARLKMAQLRDLKNPLPEADLARLKELEDYYNARLSPPTDNPGMGDDLTVKEAAALAAAEHLQAAAEGRGVRRLDAGTAAKIDDATVAEIEKLVSEIERLRVEARGELANREALRKLMEVQIRARNLALLARRDGKGMRAIHQSLAKEATIVDIAFSLKEIYAALLEIENMKKFVDQNRERVKATQKKNEEGRTGAEANQQKIAGWKAEIEQTVKDDEGRAKDIALYEYQARTAAEHVAEFQRAIPALIAEINAQDGGTSGSAAQEYQNRLDKLPTIARWRVSGGNPKDPDAVTLDQIQGYIDEIVPQIPRAEDAVRRLRSNEAAPELAGVIIQAIPGPEVRLHNPSRADILRVLTERKAYWQGRADDVQKALDGVARRLDPGNGRRIEDEFGDMVPESLPVWRTEELAKAAKAEADTRDAARKIDAWASQINGALGSQLPPLAGLSLADLQTAVDGYGNKLRAISIPDGDAPALHDAKMNLISIISVLPGMAREVIRWSQADATVKSINEAVDTILPQAQAKVGPVLTMLRDVVTDVQLDIDFFNGTGSGQDVINRKIDLLENKSLPALRGVSGFLTGTLKPFQERSIATVQPGGDLERLYKAKAQLLTEAKTLHDRTLAWGLATFGAPDGDKTTAKANIDAWAANLQRNLDGYDDAAGHHKGVLEAQREVAQREDPNFEGLETVYGEEQPFSLPRKIAKYTAERAQRAGEFNAQAKEINAILRQMEARSGGRYDLDPFFLPENVAGDAAGADVLQGIADNERIQGIVNKLKEIDAWAQTNAGQITLVNGDSSSPPVGTQPPITLNDYQQLSLLALDVVRRIVPVDAGQPQTAPLGYAIIRMLFSDGVIDTADKAWKERIPKAKEFLAEAEAALRGAVASTAKDHEYARSNGESESARQVYDRKIATFNALAAFLKNGVAFFGVKQTWNADDLGNIGRITDYYDSLYDLSDGGIEANDSELTALDKMTEALDRTAADLSRTRDELETWLGQLNPKEYSQMRVMTDEIAKLQEQTKRVLEENVKFHAVEKQIKRSETILRGDFLQIDALQRSLRKLLAENARLEGLPPALAARVEALRMNRGSWAMGPTTAKDADSLVIKKRDYGAFLDSMMASLKSRNPAADLSQIKADLLRDPRGLTGLIPQSGLVELGDGGDGFYLVYNTRFSVPNGLETESDVTVGTGLNLFGNNIAFRGYQFGSPSNPRNAPYGDKGIGIQLETLQFDRVVNYFVADVHRFGGDVPEDRQFASSVKKSRMFLFNDFAAMLDPDGTVYVGLSGFADFALNNTGEKPSFYAGVAQTSIKLAPALKLNAKQQEVFIRDPRKYLQDVNLDFTGYNPNLNRNFQIKADADDKRFSRSEIGPSLNVAQLFNWSDPLTVDLFWAHTRGTDDPTQHSGGVSILKGFTIRGEDGRPAVGITNRLTAELGQKQNLYSNHLNVTLPDYGLAIDAEGKIVGGASAYYAQISKKVGERSTISVGYGSPYVGMNNRLQLSMNTQFTLAELWDGVAKSVDDTLRGGAPLRQYNKELDEFFKDQAPDSPRVAELRRVFENDVAARILTQEIGLVAKETAELRKAGALLDNTKVRGMIGFVSNPISDDSSERTAGGGFVTGTHTEFTMTKTQETAIAANIPKLLRLGVQLRDHRLKTIKHWQTLATELMLSQWEVKTAHFGAANAPSLAVKAQEEARVVLAERRYQEALLRYNSFSGREPGDPDPFAGMGAADLRALLKQIEGFIAAPEALTGALHSLDPERLRAAVGDNPFNLIDWIPWVEQLSLSVGVQFQDMMSSQIFGFGAKVRLPIYNPTADRDKAYELEGEANLKMIAQAFAAERLTLARELERARAWKEQAEDLRPGLERSADALADAIRAYRNRLMTPSALRAAFDDWQWSMARVSEAEGQAALARAMAKAGESFVKPPEHEGPSRVESLESAWALARGRSESLAELALREKAAAAMTAANNHRIQKAFLDLHVGVTLTAEGVAWIPWIGATGIPVMPVFGFELKPEELRALQEMSGKGESEYYRLLQAKVEDGLAASLASNIYAWRAGEEKAALLESHLPSLSGRARDEAKRLLSETRSASRQARATINYLLGRDPDAPLALQVTAEQALASYSRLMAQRQPEATQRRLLETRVEVARSQERIVDLNLQTEQLYIEPVSLAVRSIGRLIDVLSGEAAGSPDLKNKARVATLKAERALEAYGRARAIEIRRAQAGLALAQRELQALAGRPDAEGRLRAAAARERAAAARAALAGLGAERAADSPVRRALPKSFAELSALLAESRRESTALPLGELEPFVPETLVHQAVGFGRYHYAIQTLGRAPIGESFTEGWVEVRLKSRDTPAEVVLALAKLQKAKTDREYRNSLDQAAAQGEIEAARFEADAHLLRWARAERAKRSEPGLDEFIARQTRRLEEQRDGIAAALGLDPAVSLEALMALVREPAGGSYALSSLAEGLMADIRRQQLPHLRRVLFDGPPPSFGNEDDLSHQLQANAVAELMSYKGFTPVAAFGIFRGEPIFGGFLEAPDPILIANRLETVVSDALRKELEATGRLKELALKLHLQMAAVESGTRLIEKRWQQVAAAERELKALSGAARGPQDPEVTAAKNRLLDSWTSLAEAVAQAKADFIALVTELEALGHKEAPSLQGGDSWKPEDLGLRPDPSRSTIDYWSQRLLDPAFEAEQEKMLARSGLKLPEELRAELRKAIDSYRAAKRNEDSVRHMDFSSRERLELLIKTDVEGRRQAAAASLGRLLAAFGSWNPELVSFLRGDMLAQAEVHKQRRVEYEDRQEALRRAYWSAVPRGLGPDGAFERLEGLARKASAAKRELLQSYLRDLDPDPERFVIEDFKIDAALKAEKAFAAALIDLLGREDVKTNPAAIRALDGLYDIRAVLSLEKEAKQSGLGMRSINLLISLGESRLAAARWSSARPDEIERIAGALQELRAAKERWKAGQDGPQGVYALTRLEQGRRLWTTQDGWLTERALELKRSRGLVVEREGRMFLKADAGELEIVGGVDVEQAARDGAQGKAAANAAERSLHGRLAKHDFALEEPFGEREGFSYEEVFGPGGLRSQGRVLFFERGDAGQALHPLRALKRAPETVAVYVRLGDKPLGRDRFPTLESLLRSEEAGEFRRLEVGPRGAIRLAERALRQRDVERKIGFVEIKLTAYGFARDMSGEVVEVYSTEDDFASQVKAFERADKGLAAARKDLGAAETAAADAEGRAERAREEARAASLEYQRRQDEARRRLAEALEKEFRPSAGEDRDAFDRRFKAELDKRLAEDDDFEDAKQAYEPAAKAVAKAEVDLREAKAKLAIARQAVADGERDLERSKTWVLHRGSELKLVLDSNKEVAGVSAPGVNRRDRDLREGAASGSQIISGDLLAAVMDGEGRVRKFYVDPSALEKAAEGWSLRSVSIGDEPAASPDGKTVRTHFRFSHYVHRDPEKGDLPVSLNRRYLESRFSKADREITLTKHWGLMPWRWGDLLLEIPRGITNTPIELLSGRDPRQEHYLGRASMYKTEGGATEHHGFLRSAVGFIDILNILPDPVERFEDPSQLPPTVTIDSPLLPGETLFSKDLRAGEKDIHLGQRAAERQAGYAREDLLSTRARALARFQGGVEVSRVDVKRGRAAPYDESVREGRVGPESIDEALLDPLVAHDPASDGSGDVVISASPRHIEIDRIEKRVRVRPGGRHYADQARAMDGYAGRSEERARRARDAQGPLERELERAERRVRDSLEERRRAGAGAGDAWDRYREIIWRIGYQEALERELARLRQRAEALRRELAWWDGYLNRLRSPWRFPDPARDRAWWGWLILLALLAAAIAAAVWHCLRDRRPAPSL